MTTSGSLWTCAVLAACGGGVDRGVRTPQAAAPPPPPPPEVELDAPRVEEEAVPIAVAELVAVADGAPIGVVTFEPIDERMILISGDFSGLGANRARAIYIHQGGSCADQGARVGGHLDPTRARHGPPASSQRHAGDFGNLLADAEGRARFSMRTDSITMEPRGPNTVVDRAVVIHVGKDTPRGDAGPALACGVIRLVDGL